MGKNDPAKEFQDELSELTAHLIEIALVDDQNFAFPRVIGNQLDGSQVQVLEANYWSDPDVNVLASIPYADLHARLTAQRAYDLKFLDGALIQLRFEFNTAPGGALRRARLAYLPSPDLLPFQTDPDTYLFDELFGDIVDFRAVTTPIRFDYDTRPSSVVDLHHPVAHVTFGQYPHCRIAATGPATPYYFLEFIVRSFYRTRDHLPTDTLPGPKLTITSTITAKESALIHFGLPVAP